MNFKYLIFLFVFLTSATSQAQANITLSTMENQRGDMEILYPKDWHSIERIDHMPYQIYVVEEKFDDFTTEFPKGFMINKVFNQHWYYDPSLEDPETLYAEMLQANKADPVSSNIRHDYITVAGSKALLIEGDMDLPDKTPITFMYVTLTKNQIIIEILFHAPRAEYAELRDAYLKIASSSRLFYEHAEKSDNQIFLREIHDTFGKIVMDQFNNGWDRQNFFGDYQRIDRMSPKNAEVLHLLAGCMFRLALEDKDPTSKQGAAATVINTLTDSNSLFEAHPDSYEEPNRSIYQSQNYFLIGDSYVHLLGELEKAETYYRKALEYHDNQQAKEALEALHKAIKSNTTPPKQEGDVDYFTQEL